jgi:hypothetical protein
VVTQPAVIISSVRFNQVDHFKFIGLENKVAEFGALFGSFLENLWVIDCMMNEYDLNTYKSIFAY